MREQYSRGELIENIISLAEELDRSPSATDLANADDYPSSYTYKKRFGSWNAAKKEAGLDIIQRPERHSQGELIRDLQLLAEEIDKSPTIQDLEEAEEYPSKAVYFRRFESWNRAKELAGLETMNEGSGERYSDEELIEYLQRLETELGRVPSTRDIDGTDNYPSSTTYKTRFGSWSTAKEEAEIDI